MIKKSEKKIENWILIKWNIAWVKSISIKNPTGFLKSKLNRQDAVRFQGIGPIQMKVERKFPLYKYLHCFPSERSDLKAFREVYSSEANNLLLSAVVLWIQFSFMIIFYDYV